MKNKTRPIFLAIAAIVLVAGIALCACGMYGQNIYNQATEMLGVKKAETMGYIMDTSTITAVAHGQNPAKLEKFLTGPMGLSQDEVKTVVDDRAVYDVKLAETEDFDTLIQYIMDSQSVTEDEAKEIRKDDEKVAPIKEEMLRTAVTEELGIDDAQFDEMVADTEIIAMFQTGFENLKANFIFMNSVTLLFMGVAVIVAGGAILLIVSMDITNIGKKKKRVHSSASNEKMQKAGNFLLNYALYIILIAILVFVCIMRPDFLKIDNIFNILKQASTKGILALGCAGLIVLAGTDLSIGRVLGLSAAVTASLVQSVEYGSRMFPQMTSPLPLIVPLLASIAVAVVFSLINGFGVAKLNLHAFIITLGTQLIAQGATCIYIESQPSGTAQALSTFDKNFLNAAAGNIPGVRIFGAPIPLVVIYFLAIAAIMWVVWNKTRLGKNMFAVGGNTEAAAVSGVNVAKTIMLVYLIAGVLYGTSAYLEAARITSVGANTGLNYELDAISACVVGGVSFSGGVGTIQGVVIGAIILQAINYSLQFLGVNPYLQYIIRGLIIILAVSIDVRKYIVKK